MRHPRARGGAGIRDLISRRGFLLASAGLALWPLARSAGAASWRLLAASEGKVSADLTAALEKSPFVYVSPLKKNGDESSCHGEVWFAWLDGSVVLTSATKSWKARAVEAGLDRARIWVGDHGRAKHPDDAFRAAPSFVARASIVNDPGLVERMLAVYGKKYPDEIGKWGERMRTGNADGTRVLLRYAPEPATRT